MKTENFEEYLDRIKEMAKNEGYDSLDETYVEHLRARYYGKDVVIGTGARITLRELKQSDLETVYRFEDARTEPVLKAFIKETRAESEAYLQAYIQQMYPLYDYGIWAVELSETGTVIGLCGFGQLEISGEEYTDLGYYISPEYRGKGLASEGIQIALKYAEEYLELSEIYAKVEKYNQRSKRLLQKFDFFAVCDSEEFLYVRKFLVFAHTS